MIGNDNYEICRKIKQLFDPENIFNSGKIVNAPRMNEHLRYIPIPNLLRKSIVKKNPYSIETMFDFSDTDGILRAIEKCNGSADCRKSSFAPGAMCPSYQATLNEKYSTRARANILREFISHSDKMNPFDHKEILDILDFCLACKACKSECPSNIDMTKLKAEFLYHYYQ